MASRAHAGAPRPTSYEEWRTWASESQQSEWVDGEVILFMPTKLIHARVSVLLVRLLAWFAERHDLGLVIAAPFEMRLARSAREPDILFVAAENLGRLTDTKLDGPADLAVEIISDDSVTRDRIEKRAEYEAAGVLEYWILDPRPDRYAFEMLALGADGRYAPIEPDHAGRYRSVVLPGFWLDPFWFWQEPLPKLDALIAAIRGEERDAP